MTSNKRSHRALSFLVGTIVLGFGSERARAQWGMGYGWGWGGFGINSAPSPTAFLNQHAQTRAASGMQARPSHRAYANSSNAYFNRIRDNGFVSHYDVSRRRPSSYQSRRTTSPGNTSGVESRPATVPTAPEPILPLGSFFDAAQKLVWPNESPINGDLKEKRDLSDQASLVVFEETRQQIAASISSVTQARQKLLDYGRPALQEIRTYSTPPIADSFHRFLLSLYDSLAQAAGPQDITPGSAPKP